MGNAECACLPVGRDCGIKDFDLSFRNPKSELGL